MTTTEMTQQHKPKKPKRRPWLQTDLISEQTNSQLSNALNSSRG